MHFPTSLAIVVLTGLSSLVSANIDGFGVPKTIKPAEDFTILLYNQAFLSGGTQEVAAAFGVAPTDDPTNELGKFITDVYIGPGMYCYPEHKKMAPTDRSNAEKTTVIGNLSYTISLPADTQKGEALFVSSFFKLLNNAQYAPFLVTLNTTITVGNETSKEYVNGWT